MLTCLRIRNLAIIDNLDLELGPGLNVLTGETGAGKSILVSALELVLGAKGRGELVRTGEKAGEVEALFDVTGDPRTRERLASLDLPADSELVVRRVLTSCGRSRAYVNGRLATQQQLADLTRGLTDISSQHEHHTLSDPNTHLGYLDAFANLGAARERVSEAYFALRKANAALSEFETKMADRSAREALLSAQVNEIEELSPSAGEDERLELDCERIRHADSLVRLSAEAAELLYERDDSVVDTLALACSRVTEAALLDVSLGPVADQLQSARSQLDDAARQLRRHVQPSRPDPEALNKLQERLYQLSKLKRRYGGTIEAALLHLQRCKTELDELSDHVATSDALTEQLDTALSTASERARNLSRSRRTAATRLAASISKELSSLGMGGARISVEVRPLAGEHGELCVDGARLSADGVDRAEFLIAPNKGEQARPLHKVASGGELSRAMLAIKCVLANLGPAGMYVFDEVDTGVGGGMAEIIGRKIQSVAKHRQVLCITHLPQIAVYADQHFKVEKAVKGERTFSSVQRLDRTQQREEIARMLGGLKITSRTRAAARELLEHARSDAA